MSYDSYLEAIKTLNLWAKHYYILDDPGKPEQKGDIYDKLFDWRKMQWEDNSID